MKPRIIIDGPGCFPWTKTFIFWPRKTITGKRIFWQQAYKRKIWLVWGSWYRTEAVVQYANLFEILKDSEH